MNLEQTKPKVLFIGSDPLAHYRVGLFNMLNNDFDITIAHTGKPIEGTEFKQTQLVCEKKGPFFWLKEYPKLDDFQVVVYSFNIRILNLFKVVFAKRNFKLLLYGIGVSASYANSYDSKKKLDYFRKLFIRKTDGVVFYEQYPVIKYQSLGADPNKLHTAYNTVLPPTDFQFQEKTFESFMFIGTLYKEKKIYDLLEAYAQLYRSMKDDIPKLDIVGDGVEYQNIKDWIVEHGLSKHIVMHGKLTSEKELKPIFSRALACISPGQAGLSVQKCFSYGVPFITAKKAITGGELFSIINQNNGFFFDGSIEGLVQTLKMIAFKEIAIEEISENAYLFYNKYRTPELWSQAFKNAIESTKYQ